jgi:hypothetical protein
MERGGVATSDTGSYVNSVPCAGYPHIGEGITQASWEPMPAWATLHEEMPALDELLKGLQYRANRYRRLGRADSLRGRRAGFWGCCSLRTGRFLARQHS